MNSLGDALKAADQHAKAEAIGQADMFGVLAEEPDKLNNPTPAANRGRSRWY
ncbi:hypothetical protein ACLB1N_17255 [Escherichia coli]